MSSFENQNPTQLPFFQTKNGDFKILLDSGCQSWRFVSFPKGHWKATSVGSSHGNSGEGDVGGEPPTLLQVIYGEGLHKRFARRWFQPL